MHISVYSLKKVLYEDEAASVNCRTEAGEITVLDKHAPLVTVLKTGAIKIVDKAGKDHYFNEISGFLEVSSKNHAKIIIDQDGENRG